MTRTRSTGRGGSDRTRSCAVVGCAVLALVLSGCSDEPERTPRGSATATATASPTSSPTSSTASVAPSPAVAAPTGSAGAAAGGPTVRTPQPTVPARPVERLPPVPLEPQGPAEVAAEAGPLRIEVVDVASVVSAGAGPGQVQGEPAVAFTVRWSNTGRAAVPLGTVVVDLSYGDGVPAGPVDGPPSRPVSGSVPPGGSVTGVYVFRVPEGEREQVELTVSEGPALPTAVFRGPVP